MPASVAVRVCTPTTAPGLEKDGFRWCGNVLWTGLFVSIYLSWSFRLYSGGNATWDVPGDIWVVYFGAIYVIHGGYAFIYQSSHSYDYLPLPAVLMAPCEWVGERLHLVAGVPFYVRHPSMWLVYGPVTAVLCTPVTWASRALAWALGVRRRLWCVQLTTLLVVSVPCAVFGHFEDALAIAALLMVWRAATRSRCVQMAVWCAVAIACKEWTILAVPLFVARTPRGQRLRVSAIALLPPFLMVVPCLARNFWGTVSAVFLTADEEVGRNGHPGFVAALVPGALGRAGVLLLAPLIVLLAKRLPLPAALSVVGCVFALRVVCEPVAFAYYWAAPLGVLILLATVTAYRISLLRCAVAMIPAAWSWPLTIKPDLWWPGMALALACLGLALRDAFRAAGQSPPSEVVAATSRVVPEAAIAVLPSTAA